MPGLDGLAAARVIVADTASRVLMLTTFDSDEYVYTALRAGASGFLLKDTPSQHLVTAVRSVAAGDALIDPAITRRLHPAVRPRHAAPAPPPRTAGGPDPRERDVLRHIAQGLSNAEIARELTVEENTVKTHVGRILTKLGLRDRVQAVVLAYETGFVVPDRPLSCPRAAPQRSGRLSFKIGSGRTEVLAVLAAAGCRCGSPPGAAVSSRAATGTSAPPCGRINDLRQQAGEFLGEGPDLKAPLRPVSGSGHWTVRSPPKCGFRA